VELFWVCVGAAGAWFLFRFRATKAAIAQAVDAEFRGFVRALDAWNADRNDFDAFTAALHHFAVYEERQQDFTKDPTGRTLPAERAVLSSGWVKLLKEARYLESNGRPSPWSEASRTFWESVAQLRNERDRLLTQAAPWLDNPKGTDSP
jgi:hypothetical protein